MRKRRAVKRDVLADPMYNSKLVTKLINRLMVKKEKHKQFFINLLISLQRKLEKIQWKYFKLQWKISNLH